MRRFLNLAALTLLLTGCCATIHIYPDPGESSGIVTLMLQPSVDRDPPLYHKEIVYDSLWNRTVTVLDETPAAAYTPADGYALRIIMDVYEGTVEEASQSTNPQGDFVERYTLFVDADASAPQGVVETDLPDGEYYVLAWADYVPENAPLNWHYYADTLRSVWTDLETYPSDMHLRSSAAGQQEFLIDYTLSEEGYPSLQSNPDSLLKSGVIPVYLERPSGRYRIISTDSQDFIDKGGALENMTVEVTYKQFVSYGYNVASQSPNSFISSYSFSRLSMDDAPEDEFQLVGDYIFTSYSGETIVLADFCFYDIDGVEINRVEDVEVPLRRNHETVIRGAFLTNELEGGGSVSIDENFEDEYVITINQ